MAKKYEFSRSIISTTNATHLESVIEGDRRKLLCSFAWASSEFGFQHWHDVCHGNKAMTDEDKDYLSQLSDAVYEAFWRLK